MEADRVLVEAEPAGKLLGVESASGRSQLSHDPLASRVGQRPGHLPVGRLSHAQRINSTARTLDPQSTPGKIRVFAGGDRRSFRLEP
jgi:hypothetical protein